MNRNIWIGIIVVLVVLLVVFMFTGDRTTAPETRTPAANEEQELEGLNTEIETEFKTIDDDSKSL
jgi:hypothetical protein